METETTTAPEATGAPETTGGPKATGAPEAASAAELAGVSVLASKGVLGQEVLHVTRDQYLEVIGSLREGGFEMCADLCAVDYLRHPDRPLPEGVTPERFEVVVNLLSLERHQPLERSSLTAGRLEQVLVGAAPGHDRADGRGGV